MIKHVTSSKSISDWPLHICYAVYGQTAKCVAVLSPCLSVINPCDSLQKWITEKRNWPKHLKVQGKKKKLKVTLGAKFELNVNGFMEEITDPGNIDTGPI